MFKTLLNKKYSLFFCLSFLSLQAWAQTGTIAGSVSSDVDNEKLIGARLKLLPTGETTTTDGAGNFLFSSIPAGQYTLRAIIDRFDSSETKVTVTNGSTSTVNIKLSPKVQGDDNVVIVGYGRQTRRDVVGSISTVTGKELTELPAPSFEAALQGKASGVQVVVGSGMAGSSSLIRIRGVASISASGDPLYVIDGIPVTQDNFLNRTNGNNYGGGFNNNPLASINPEDIEDVQILKDAAATSIYGSRGANGVILITTKRAKKKGLKFDFSTRIGISVPTRKPEMLSGPEWLQLYQEAWENDGRTGTPDFTPIGINMTWAEAQNINTNWVDQVIGVGLKQNYNIGLSYVGKKWNVRGVFSYDDNGSYLIGNSYKRASERINLDWKPIKGLNIQLSQSLSSGTNNRVDAAWAGGLGSAMSTMLPIYPLEPLLNSNGVGFRTPVGLQTVRQLKNWRSIELRSIGNINISYEFAKNFVANVSSSIDYMDFNEHLFEPRQLRKMWDFNYPWQGEAQWWPSWTMNYNYYATLQYNKDLNKKNRIEAMVGHEYQKSNTKSKYVKNYNTTQPLDQAWGPDSTLQTTAKTPYTWAFISFFGRVNYKWNNRFNLQGTLRSDGSSRFGKNNRYGYFPALAAGYILSEEAFLKRSKIINFLKLRAGIGRSGNANFNNYARWGTITPSANLNPPYNGQPRLEPARLENPNLRWETTRNIDVSIEWGILKNRVSGEFTFYHKYTKDVILELQVPRSLGFKEYYDNVGEIMNRGVEFNIRAIAIDNRKTNFNWTINFNIARNYNEIKSIGNYTEDAVSGGTNDTRVVVGKPVGTNFLVRFSHVDAATGKPVYLDKEGNQTMKWDPADRVAVGNVLPKAFGSLGNTFRWKEWDLNANIYFNIGGNIYESSAKRQLGVYSDWNSDARIFDRWQKPGDESERIARLTLNNATYGSSTPWINTTQWLENASYARLRNLSLGYTFSNAILKKWKIEAARLGFVAVNILTFTKYTGLDPEIARDFESATDRNMSGSITYLTPPQEKSYSVTLNITF